MWQANEEWRVKFGTDEIARYVFTLLALSLGGVWSGLVCGWSEVGLYLVVRASG